MATIRPIQFSAVHAKTRWREARHASLYNAIEGTSRCSGIFDQTKEAIDFELHVKPLYVVVWDERDSSRGVICLDPCGKDALVRTHVPMERILHWIRSGGPRDDELERLIGQKYPTSTTLARRFLELLP